MPHEWNALVEGEQDERKRKRREHAHWVGLLLSAQCGKQITGAQLMGDEPFEGDVEGRAQKYERELEKELRKSKRRRKALPEPAQG